MTGARFLALAVFLLPLVAAGQPAWNAPTGFQTSMSIVATVDMDGVRSSDARDMLASVVGAEIRGVASPTVVGGSSVYFLSVAGETEGERITFRVYDASGNVVRTMCSSVSFRSDVSLGTLEEPLALSTSDGSDTGACPESWQAIGGYSTSMTILAAVFFPSGRSSNTADRVAAYVGTEIRGTGVPFSVGGNQVFRIDVAGDPGATSVVFRAWEAASGLEYRFGSEIPFVPGGLAGTSTSPCLLYRGGLPDGCEQGVAPSHPDGNTLLVSGAEGTDNDEGWRLLSAPVTAATRADLVDDVDMTVASGSVLYGHDGTDYFPITDDSTPLTSGRGFLLYVFDDQVDSVDDSGLRIDLPGSPPSTDVTVTGLRQDRRWHLLGNPFDTDFDLSALDLVSRGFQATVQIWDRTEETWKLVTQDVGHDDLIAVWQGFFAERTTVGAGQTSVLFSDDGRMSGAELVGGKGASAERTRLRIVVSAPAADGSLVARDDATLLVLAAAAEGWDPYDASKLPPPMAATSVQVSFTGERDGLPVAQAQLSIPDFRPMERTFPLAIRSQGTQSRLRLSWPEMDRVPPDWTLQIRDSSTGLVADLRETTEVWLEGPVEDSRLSLVITSSATTTTEHEAPSDGWVLDAAFPNPFSESTLVGVGAPVSGRARVSVFDLQGRRVGVPFDGILPAGHSSVRLNGLSLASGLYLVVLEAGGQRRQQSVLVNR